MRAVFGLLACMASVPAWANGAWQVATESPEEIVSIDLSRLERDVARISFRERHVVRGRQIDSASLRPIREVLLKRMIDCRSRRIATLSRAAFSDDDALIDHRAVHPRQAEWKAIAREDPVFRLVCGSSASLPLPPTLSHAGRGGERDAHPD
jgi:hypothetical protein